MALSRRPLLLLVAMFAVALFAAPAVSGAQETTSETDEVLTRYDSPATAELAADYEAARQREEELEAEIESLEEQGEYGPSRQALREELNEIEDETVAANALGDSRYQDILDTPVEGTKKQRAASLREKAASMMALQRWADSAPLDINSSLYYWGQASDKATEYRAAASALEATAVVPETTEETASETTAAAPPGDGGEAEGDPEANPAPANEANEPGASGGSDTGGFGITSLLAAALIFLGVGYYLVGLFREGLGARAKLVGAPQQARAPKAAVKKPPMKSRQDPGDATERPGAVTEPREASGGSSDGEDSPGAAESRVTPATKSHQEETDTLDEDSLAAWFSQEMEEPTKKAPEATPKPTPKPGVNQVVAEEVARMREAGELSEEDEVEVRIEGGKIMVRKKE